MPASESRRVRDFYEVMLRGYGDMVVEQGDHESLVVEADPPVLRKIKSVVRNGRLVLSYMSWLDPIELAPGSIRYHITMRNVSGIFISGMGTLRAAHIQTDGCRLEIGGSGEMEIDDLEARALIVSISCSGFVSIGGQAQRQDVNISGSGKLEAAKLESHTADISISGSGEATIQVHEMLSAHIHGHGHILYRGQPQVRPDITGAGRIQHLTDQ